MSYDEIVKRRVSIISQWEKSAEYAQLCMELQRKRKLLIDVGLEFIHCHNVDVIKNLHPATKLEYAVGGNIHRGVYCPSPVYDLLNGKSYRGRILKRVTAVSKISHRFGFDDDGNLLYADNFCDREVYSTEYFVTRDHIRYGITVNRDGFLNAISEEIFCGSQLVQYTFAQLLPDDNGYFCENIYVEKYNYDEQGLKSCEVEYFQPYVNALRKDHCEFERKDGFLYAYICESYPLNMIHDGSFSKMRYHISLKRKAW